MIQYRNKPRIIYFCFILIIGFIAGCEKQDTPVDEKSAMKEKSHSHPNASTDPNEEQDGLTPKQIKYWTCVMHPAVKMTEKGDCPVCKMELIPVHEGAGLTLTERQKALIPIRTEPVEFRELAREIRTVGVLDYNETRIAYASTRISGWIQDLHVDFTGINVREGDELLTIYSPELLAAQEEYLTALNSVDELKNTEFPELKRTVEQTVTAAKSKLELFGLTPAQIDQIREHGEAQTTLPLYAPSGGTVIHMNVNKGQYVNRGAHLYRIADLKSLWIIADIYEYELPWVYTGQDVEITTQATPDQTFHGKVNYIYPYFDAPTRTQKVHIEVPNPDGQLRPGMYVTLRLKPTLAEIYAREAHPKAPYADHAGHSHAQIVPEPKPLVQSAAQEIWVCPMHPQEQSHEPDECDICGMDLVKKQAKPEETHQHTVGHEPPPLIFKYVCPDHPDQYATLPDECPIGGKRLVMTGEVLAVPKSAVIDTGLRKIVFIDRGESGYEQLEVELGPEAWAEVTHNGRTTKQRFYPVVKGVNPGDRVVTNGNFLLDSQTQLTGTAAGAYSGALGGEEKSSAPHHHH